MTCQYSLKKYKDLKKKKKKKKNHIPNTSISNTISHVNSENHHKHKLIIIEIPKNGHWTLNIQNLILSQTEKQETTEHPPAS